MSLQKPTDLGRRILEASPEARAARRAQRKADLAPPLGGKALRGMRRSSPEDGHRLLPIGSDIITADKIEALALHLEGNHPVLNKFNDKYQVKPTRDAINAYISGGVKTNEPIPPPSDPKAVREYFADRRRQALTIGDQLQIEAFKNRNIARLRRYSLLTTQFLGERGRDVDSQALLNAADAVQDFGQTLSERSSELLAPIGDEDLGYQITVIGMVANHDARIITDNPELLDLVLTEQKAREEQWDELYSATLSHPDMGDRLEQLNHNDEIELQAELARMALLRQD